MDKDVFCLYDAFRLDENNQFGRANVKHVEITKTALDEAITKIVLDDDNLIYLFSLNPLFPLTGDKKALLLNRFLPEQRPTDVLTYVTSTLVSNHNFYSFLAEAVLAILMKDVFKYKLSACVLRNTDTIIDSHTGVDSCFYDSKNKKLIMGEAKFYKAINNGVRTIEADLTINDGIENKLNSFLRTASSNRKSKKIILHEAGVRNYRFLSFEDFLELDLIFAGFVMHENDNTMTGKELSQLCGFSSIDIENNIAARYPNLTDLKYSLYMFHLPIESKEKLISLIIEKAYLMKEGC